MKVTVSGPNMEARVLEYSHKIRIETILQQLKDHSMPYPIYACKLNNAYRSLAHVCYHDSTIEFLDMRETAVWHIYQDSLVLLYIKAVHDILGKDVIVSIKNSLNKGLFTIIKAHVDYMKLAQIEKRMRELVDADLPISKVHLSIKEAAALTKRISQNETYRMIQSANRLEDIQAYTLDDEKEIFYNLLVPSTSYLQYFELKQYQNGVLLRFPHQNNPTVIPEYEDQRLLFDAFYESDAWGDLMHTNFVADLNEKVLNGSIRDVFLMQEALHEKKISDIADDICARKKRVVLICGPSSSGKTTFARRLCIQLGVNGKQTLYLGTDDYFVEADEKPLDENGEVDYESIRAVDTALFCSDLRNLLKGKKVDLPTYDFIENRKIFGRRMTRIDSGTVIVIEGIHALNALLTKGIDEKEKFKIYISPFTPIGIDHHNRISTTDARMLRRMVRDNQFRNKSAAMTIAEWPKVRKGEEENIFPYTQEADVFFDSDCIYELAVLKKYAEPLLKEIKRHQPEYADARRMLDFLQYIVAVEDDSEILANSIIREFIGGSIIVK